MKNKINQLIISSKKQISVYKPLFFTLSIPSDKTRLEKLFKDTPPLFVHDYINGQIEELIKLQNPTIVYTKDELTNAAKKHIENIPSEEYGIWVYYPWSGRLIHILDEEEFVKVRTNRNQYKITPEERSILSKKKIGIIGLSVGHPIAMTLAMERCFGELRLADFDRLELSNLNRIRTGLHNLNTSKITMVAREIAEIDPFLKITCYHEGITKENMNDFFVLGGKLDVVIDECDSLAIKISCRLMAKELQIAVVMDTSDRGMIDIERFDLEPDRMILHGLIENINAEKLDNLSSNERISLILKIIGGNNISERLKLSWEEIGHTISTWPQLASSVMLGGATGADICRRILLNQLNISGRFYIDLEQLIKD